MGRVTIDPTVLGAALADLPSAHACDLAVPFISTIAPPSAEEDAFWSWTRRRCKLLMDLIIWAPERDFDRVTELIRQCMKDERTVKTFSREILNAAVYHLYGFIQHGAALRREGRPEAYSVTLAGCALLLMLPLKPRNKNHVEQFVEWLHSTLKSQEAPYAREVRDLASWMHSTPGGMALLMTLCK